MQGAFKFIYEFLTPRIDDLTQRWYKKQCMTGSASGRFWGVAAGLVPAGYLVQGGTEVTDYITDHKEIRGVLAGLKVSLGINSCPAYTRDNEGKNVIKLEDDAVVYNPAMVLSWIDYYYKSLTFGDGSLLLKELGYPQFVVEQDKGERAGLEAGQGYVRAIIERTFYSSGKIDYLLEGLMMGYPAAAAIARVLLLEETNESNMQRHALLIEWLVERHFKYLAPVARILKLMASEVWDLITNKGLRKKMEKDFFSLKEVLKEFHPGHASYPIAYLKSGTLTIISYPEVISPPEDKDWVDRLKNRVSESGIDKVLTFLEKMMKRHLSS